jgi:hypothetical protein
MKKLLTLLTFLIVSTTYGQDMFLDHSYTTAAPFQVGQIITIKFNTVAGTGSNVPTPTLLQFDYQYNNKLLEKVEHTFKINSNGNNTTAQTSLNSWAGYKFTPATNIDVTNLSGQHGVYPTTATYTTSADWTVERITIQDGKAISHNATLLEIKFRIKDRGLTTYTDYASTTSLNWANFKNNATGVKYSTNSLTQNINLGNVTGVNAGDVIVNLNTNSTHPTDYSYKVYKQVQMDTITNLPKPNEVAFKTGTFDANKQAIISGLTIGETYAVFNNVIDKPTWLDDVVTITDAYLIFREALSAGSTPNGSSATFPYLIQSLLGEVTNDNKIDFDDSYAVLAHVNGVDSATGFFTNVIKGAYNLSGRSDLFGSSYVNTFVPTDSDKVFNFSHALRGDVDFSHSFEPTTTTSTNKSASMRTMSAMKTMSVGSMVSKNVQTYDLDISSSLVDGKVVVSISTNATDLVGTQFKINFDESMLTLDEVKYDTGNEMTNFANRKDNSISVGSLDYNGVKKIKSGTPYKLIFTPKQAITNTAGLVNFTIKEGVTSDGTKIKFNVQ